jgi:hypothetical protein
MQDQATASLLIQPQLIQAPDCCFYLLNKAYLLRFYYLLLVLAKSFFVMLKVFFAAVLFFGTITAAMAQLSVGYHQSNVPFAAIGYEISDRLMPELRISTDIIINNFSPELVLTYQFLHKPDYELYAGLGYRANTFQGPLLPVGLNIFPFDRKNFGFHVELAPILVIESTTILRGSWGIRYRFGAD